MGVSPFRPTSGQSYEDDITQSQGLTKATPIHPNLKKKKPKKNPVQYQVCCHFHVTGHVFRKL